jgi:hypothetical protein
MEAAGDCIAALAAAVERTAGTRLRHTLGRGPVEALDGKRQDEQQTRRQQEPWFHSVPPGNRAAPSAGRAVSPGKTSFRAENYQLTGYVLYGNIPRSKLAG